MEHTEDMTNFDFGVSHDEKISMLLNRLTEFILLLSDNLETNLNGICLDTEMDFLLWQLDSIQSELERNELRHGVGKNLEKNGVEFVRKKIRKAEKLLDLCKNMQEQASDDISYWSYIGRNEL